MATVQGVFQGLVISKEGNGKRGPWKLYSIEVDGKRYGVGFEPVKAAVGDRVSFETATNERGYEEADAKTFRVVAVAAQGSNSGVSGNASGSGEKTNNDPRQQSIELQSSISSASRIVAAQISAGVSIASPAQAVNSLVSSFIDILHPRPKAQPSKPQQAAQDFSDDGEIPY